jgi:hypothetical protein
MQVYQAQARGSGLKISSSGVKSRKELDVSKKR